VRRVSIFVLILGGAALACLVTACGSRRAAGPPPSLVRVRESDYRIVLRPARVHAGRVRIRVDNLGPANHELILVHALRTGLPIRTDGLTVNEETVQPDEVAALEPAVPGTVRYLNLDLPKGDYEVFCNMAGHYMGGMRAFLVVA
jgi:uncharacterized cupredoxin-like copper-binding protein